MIKRLVVDLETKRSFAEVGGADHRARLGVSVVGVYDYQDDRFSAFREDRFDALAALLREADEIIGFNLLSFDWPVLAAELGDWVLKLPSLDLMVEAQQALGHRVSLDALARASLGIGKIGSGLLALSYYQAGDWERLERYCLEDVKLTRDLYDYARRHGHLYVDKGGRKAVVPVSFAEHPLAKVFVEAAKVRGSVRMTYGAKERLVEVQAFDGVYIRGYCHLKQQELTFRLDRVEAAVPAPSSKPLF
jgi:hypothetical protein